MCPTVIFQRGCLVEKVEASKHRSVHWHFNKTFAICVGVHAKRDSDGVRQETSGRGSDRPGKSFLCIHYMTDGTIFPSC